ncbi:MAG: tetratricopeptide repeat protein [Marinobacter sp.]|nr:tetratricopeptide repeat protein [Marinobacter sp.]
MARLHLRSAVIALGLICNIAYPVAAAEAAPLAVDAGADAAADPRALFRAGAQAFNEGDLQRARELLERARHAGLASDALRYNLGVVYYRLGDLESALREFMDLVSTRHRDLALYNLGLVAQAQGRSAVAQDYFTQVAKMAEQDNLRRLAMGQLVSAAQQQQEERRWLGYLSLSAGYEDNLSLLPDAVSSNLADTFSEAILVARGSLWQRRERNRLDRLELTGNLYRRHYYSESDFSNDAAQLAIAWVTEQGPNHWRAALNQGWIRTGGEPREWQTSVDLRARHTGCGSHPSSRCELALRATYIRPYERFKAYEGTRYQLTASQRDQWGNWQGDLRYRFEVNNRRDLELDDLFVSLSPWRHGVQTSLRYRRWPSWVPGLEADYRLSDYPDRYRLGEDAEGRRRDHRYQGRGFLEVKPSQRLLITLEGSYTRNDSALPRYDYDNQVYQLVFGLIL